MICISFPYLNTEVHERLRPILRTLPFCIEKNGRVFACNAIAQRRGIQPGQLIRNVRSRVYGVVIEKEKQSRYETARKEITRFCLSFSRHVEQGERDSVYILPEKQSQQHDEHIFATDIAKSFRTVFPFTVNLGCGSNKFIARCAASFSTSAQPFFVHKQIEQLFIRSLPVTMLPGIGKRAGSALQEKGVTTMGSFADMPEHEAEALFGKSGKQLLALANGKDDSIKRPYKLPALLRRTFTSNVPLVSPGSITAATLFVGHQVKATLERESIIPGEIIVTFTSSQHQYVALKQRTINKTLNALLPAVRSISSQLADHAHFPIHKITIQCGKFASAKHNYIFRLKELLTQEKPVTGTGGVSFSFPSLLPADYSPIASG